jgi:hypothetical protein
LPGMSVAGLGKRVEIGILCGLACGHYASGYAGLTYLHGYIPIISPTSACTLASVLHGKKPGPTQFPSEDCRLALER